MRFPVSTDLRLVNDGGALFYEAADGRRVPFVRGGDGDAPTLDELIARAGDLSGLTDDELTALDADISAAAEALAEGGITGDDVVTQLTQAGDACQAIRAEQETRDEAAAARQAEADEALARIRGPQASGDDDPDVVRRVLEHGGQRRLGAHRGDPVRVFDEQVDGAPAASQFRGDVGQCRPAYPPHGLAALAQAPRPPGDEHALARSCRCPQRYGGSFPRFQLLEQLVQSRSGDLEDRLGRDSGCLPDPAYPPRLSRYLGFR